MSDISRFGVSAEDELLHSFDQLITSQGYSNRSEALRDLMRDALIKAKLKNAAESDEVLGTLTLVYDHHHKDLADKMAELQHLHYESVVSVMHVHISHDDCMEVIVLRGEIRSVRTLANSLLSLKGVKHGELFVTVAARQIIEQKRGSNGHPTHHHRHAPERI